MMLADDINNDRSGGGGGSGDGGGSGAGNGGGSSWPYADVNQNDFIFWLMGKMGQYGLAASKKADDILKSSTLTAQWVATYKTEKGIGNVGPTPVLPPPPPAQAKADFITNIDGGVVPLSVTFTDKSFNPQGLWYIWDFGDGLTDATANPVHVYGKPGIYTVKLSLWTFAAGTPNPGFQAGFFVGPEASIKATSTKIITVTSSPTVPTAKYINITVSPFEGVGQTKVQCSVESIQDDGLVYQWDFGDGATFEVDKGASFTANHVYNNPGTYTVSLTSYRKATANEVSKPFTVDIGDYISVVASTVSNTKNVTISKPVDTTPTLIFPTKLQAVGHIFQFMVTNKIMDPVELDVRVDAYGSQVTQNLTKNFKIKVNRITRVETSK